MNQYKINLDGGEGGSKTVMAANAEQAFAMGIEWAKGGDWGANRVSVPVWAGNVDDEDDEAEGHCDLEDAR